MITPKNWDQIMNDEKFPKLGYSGRQSIIKRIQFDAYNQAIEDIRKASSNAINAFIATQYNQTYEPTK
jgi:hypothetical protein